MVGNGEYEGFSSVDGRLDFHRKHLVHLSRQDNDDGDVAFQEELQHILFELRLETADDAVVLRHAGSPVETLEDVSAGGLAGAEEGGLLALHQVLVSDMG